MRNKPLMLATAAAALSLLGACSGDSDASKKAPVDPRVVDLDRLDSSAGGQAAAPANAPDGQQMPLNGPDNSN